MRSRIYLDHNATTPLNPVAKEQMSPFLGDCDANPSSLYLEAEQVRGQFEQARKSMAACFGIRPGELFFTSGATESINWAIRGTLAANPKRQKFITSKVEHSVTLDIARRLEQSGVDVHYLDVDSGGELNLDELESALDDQTAILSLLWTNNETGVEFDVAKIGAMARKKGVIFHLDAAQKVGKGLPQLSQLPIDLLSFSGHKFGAPKGIGGLYMRNGVGVRPLIWGGHQETGQRAGTENVSGVMAMASALSEATEKWPDQASTVRQLRDRLQEHLVCAFPEAIVNGAVASRNENTLSMCFPGIEGHGVVLTLSQKGLACASGSACTAHDEGPSHVLAAMGVGLRFIHGAIRFSLGANHTEAEIDKAAGLIIASVHHVSRI
ncbi:MAG: cysteine desulfurase [Planctomycetota bacterium]|jgi:cysteine desulfurase